MQITNHASAANHKSQQTPASEPDPRIFWLWAKLTARYGQKWASQWEDDRLRRITQAEWSQSLARYSMETIGQAVEMWTDTWPPTLVDMLQLCKPRPAAQRRYQALPKPADREAGTEAIDVIKKYLKMADPAPHRQDPDYVAWSNSHRRVIGMTQILWVNADNSFELRG